MTRSLGIVAVAILILYPPLVYLGTKWLEPRYIGLALAGIYGARLGVKAANTGQRLVIVAGFMALAGALWWINDERLLKLWPALINAVVAVYFTYTLYYPPTLPARMARLEFPQGLPPIVEVYTAWVTRLWVVFLLCNGAVAAYTALFSSREVWALYNGGIAYGLMGALFAGEFAYRQLYFKKKHGL
ncbi:hypothetical protein [Gilvimarinus xylanilyticus]|uniref:Intracellular septation protein A n=1 Tax=Gilvimarinus xylanilyticus TaxID=2944139 RepID=A0A9X2KUB0_9GAMM|nr:hypothetical protein [Gilvimarinus xylanilyticus]MCP8900134.1 hypothetical protein [Gilvimarinus xylanilyticus]